MNKRMKTSQIVWIALAILSFSLSSCGVIHPTAASPTEPQAVPTVTSSGEVIAEGHVMPNDDASLAFKVSGNAAEVNVKEGDRVKNGAVLASLGDRERYTAAVTAAKMEQTDAQQKLDNLKLNADASNQQALLDLITAQKAVDDTQYKMDRVDTDNYQDELRNAQADVTSSKDRLNKKQEKFDKYKDLDEDSSLRKDAESALRTARREYDDSVRRYNDIVNRMDKAKENLALAQANFKYAKAKYDERKDGIDSDTLALAQARVDNAGAQLASAQAALDDLDLKAPFDCTVAKVDLSPNEPVFASQPVITVADTSEWYVETDDLTEKDVVKLTIGQNATLTADALPDVQMKGQIERISQYYVDKSGDIDYIVRIKITNPDPQLRWGMTVKVSFVKE
jgi:multidrug resistance efflux pump